MADAEKVNQFLSDLADVDSSAQTSLRSFKTPNYDILLGGIEEWKQDTDYLEGALVYNGHVPYVALESHNSGDVFDLTLWMSLSGEAVDAYGNPVIDADLFKGNPIIAVEDGGTGLSAIPVDGQLLIGNGSGYTLSTLTEGDGINVTNASGSITIEVDLGAFVLDDLGDVATSASHTDDGMFLFRHNGVWEGRFLQVGDIPSGVGLTSPVGVADGGTGLTATPTNGQVLIGNGSGFTLATIDESDGIDVTDGSGSITIGLDLNELTTETSIAAGDFIAMVDITDSGSGKITFSNLEGSIDHGNLVSSSLDDDDHSHYIHNAPSSGTRNLITIAAASEIGLGIRGHASQSASPFQIVTSASANLFEVTTSGSLNVGAGATFGASIVITGSGGSTITVDAAGSGLSTATLPNVTGTVLIHTTSTTTTHAMFAEGTAGEGEFRAIVSGDLPTVPVSKGGTGITGTPTNGQLLIGNGSNYTLATITEGTAIDVANASGSITISVDLNEFATETSIASGDFIAMVDITDNGSGKITFANFEGTIDHGNITGRDDDDHSQYIFNAPTESRANLITCSEDGAFGLKIVGHASQNQNILQVETSAGGVLLACEESGDVGIGIDNPTQRLHVHEAGANCFLRITTDQPQCGFELENDNNEWRVSMDASDNVTFRDVTGGTNVFSVFSGAPNNSFRCRVNQVHFNSSHANLDIEMDGQNNNKVLHLDASADAVIFNAGSQFDTNGDLIVRSAASDPTGSEGMIYYHTGDDKLKVYANGAWETITSST